MTRLFTLLAALFILSPHVSAQTSAPFISAGSTSSYSVGNDGTVWAWGRGNLGQLGDAAFTNSPKPVLVRGLASVKAISANNHVMALQADGSVWVWGQNTYGQLGTGTTAASGVPIAYTGISGVTAVAAGSSYSVALKADGSVWTWGKNELGQFGNGTSDTPMSSAPKMAAGNLSATAIAAGDYHTVALLRDGTVAAWGNNKNGQLGTSSSDQCTQWAGHFACALTPLIVTGLSNIVAISSGGSHVLAMKADGTVWAWGLNDGGQLGDGSTMDSPTPKQVSSLSNVIAIAAGRTHSLALKADGTVWAWGWNDKGQLGYLTNETCTSTPVACSKSPSQVPNLTDVSAISGGSVHSLALKTDGSVWAWGMGKVWGQLGNNSTLSDSNTPLQVVGQGGQGTLNLGTLQTSSPAPAPTASPTLTSLDCLLNWAEASYPELFPSGTKTISLGVLSYRYYTATQTYLVLTTNDGQFVYIGSKAPNNLLFLGAISDWYKTAKCQ